MSPQDQKNAVVLALLVYWLWNRPEVTTSIEFPENPEGYCYDPETGAYYVGDC